MLPVFFRCLRDESGQGIIEYAMIIALVATGALTALHAVGGRLSSFGAALDPFSGAPHMNVTINPSCDWHVTDTQSSCANLRQ